MYKNDGLEGMKNSDRFVEESKPIQSKNICVHCGCLLPEKYIICFECLKIGLE